MIPHSKPYLPVSSLATIEECYKSGMISSGKIADKFRESLSARLNGERVFLTPNGTSAFQIILMALDIKSGDEIILPTYVCPSVAKAILAVGGTPIFCDIGDNWISSPENYLDCKSKKTKAILLVNTFGIHINPDDYASLNLPVIWDRCHDYPHAVQENLVVASFFSFHATKFMTTGNSGCLVLHRQELLSKVEAIFNEGEYSYFLHGILNDLNAEIGIQQLELLSIMTEQRIQNAQRYFKEINNPKLKLPFSLDNRCSFYRFPVRHSLNFEELKSFFEGRQISVRRGVDTLLHREFSSDLECPNAEKTFNETLSLPVYPGLTPLELDHIIQACNEL